jgi:hypothetical protein
MRRREEQAVAPTLSEAQEQLLKRIQSSERTRYRVITKAGVELNVFCANDAMLYTILAMQPVTLEAEPPVGTSFTLRLTPEGPERFDLWQSLVCDAQVLPEVKGAPSRRCPFHHLFERQADAERWHGTLASSLAPVVEIVRLGQGWRRALALVESLAAPEGEAEQ